MSRREIVLLVSRAIAMVLVVPSLISFVLSIPTQILTASMLHSYSSPTTANLFRMQGLSLLANLLGLGLHFFAAMLFWQCGPMIERMLLPAGSAESDPAV
jgi:hypothetical protein